MFPHTLRTFVIAFAVLPVLAGADTTDSLARAKPSWDTGAPTTAALIAGKVPGVQFEYDVSYLPPDRAEKLDLYQPKEQEPGKLYPAVVMIHGGGWVGGLKDAKRERAFGTALAKAGYVAVSVEYMKEAEKRWPTNLHDCKNAVRWLRVNAKRLQVDPDRIGVIGGSAGGHLALMVAFTTGVEGLEPEQPYPGISSAVSACVNLYGITNVATRQGTDKSGKPTGTYRTNTALFRESLAEVTEKARKASPVTYADKDLPPTLTLHGTKDTTVDRDQAYELAKKLKEAGAPHELRMIPDAPHSFTLNDKRLSRDLRPEVLAFFDKHLKE